MTAETAVVLPALTVLLALAVWVVGVAGAQLRCVDAARAAARAIARGDAVDAAVAAGDALAPSGATVTVARDGELAVVDVRARVVLPGPWRRHGPGIDVHSRGVALVER